MAIGKIPPGSFTIGNPPPPTKEDLGEILGIMERYENEKYHVVLRDEMNQAKAIYRELNRKDRVKALHFDARVLRKLRATRNPLEPVHDVVVAFFLFLGEYEGYTRVFVIIFHFLYLNVGLSEDFKKNLERM